MFDNIFDVLSPSDVRFDACPFCGSKRINHESMGASRWARCQKCSATGGYVFNFEPAPMTRDEVVKRWNTRAEGGDVIDG